MQVIFMIKRMKNLLLFVKPRVSFLQQVIVRVLALSMDARFDLGKATFVCMVIYFHEVE